MIDFFFYLAFCYLMDNFSLVLCKDGAILSFEVINKILMHFCKNRTRYINIGSAAKEERTKFRGEISFLVNILSKNTYKKTHCYINVSSTAYYL